MTNRSQSRVIQLCAMVDVRTAAPSAFVGCISRFGGGLARLYPIRALPSALRTAAISPTW